MNRPLVMVESDGTVLRAAMVIERRLEAIEIDDAEQPSLVGAIGQARTVRTLRGMGTIVRFSDGPELLLVRGRTAPPGDGQVILAQVVRDPDGDKLGTAASSVSLAGRALIHLPREEGIAMSRRIAIAPDRKAELEAMLRALPGGWILRQSAPRLDSERIAVEATALAAEGAALSGTSAPPDAFRRLMVDRVVDEPRILVSGRGAVSAVEGWCARFAPDLSPAIEYHDPGTGLFDAYDLDVAISALREPRVALGQGGSLIIEPTTALTAIDVNSGGEANALGVNLVAAAEIARQLRLRHIGGLIVIDFVSMPRPADGAKVADALRDALADDAAQTHILPMSRLGLIEMTRDRRGPRLVFPK